MTLRPLVAADAAALEALVAQGLSAASRRYRFHGAVNGCPPELSRRLADVDGGAHVALGAWVRDGDHDVLVGEARYCVEADGVSAELAIAVADAWQGHGIADALLRALLNAARRAGLRWLYGIVLDNNARMAAFMARHGFATCAGSRRPGMLRFERGVAAPALHRAPRAEHRVLAWVLERCFGIAVPAAL